MTSIYHRRFYPADVDGTVAYVAPNDAVNAEDSAYTEFFEEVGSQECRSALTALEREALAPQRAELAQRFASAAAAGGWTFESTIGTVDRALEMVVLDTAWAFWQYLGEASCADVPAPGATTDDIYAFLDAVVSFGFYTDEGLERYIPYYFQAGTQLGYPVPSFDRLEGLLRYPGLYQPRSVVPRELGQRTRDSYWYEAAGANHGATIAALTPAERAEATLAVQRWAGVATPTPARAAAPRVAALDSYNEALDRRTPWKFAGVFDLKEVVDADRSIAAAVVVAAPDGAGVRASRGQRADRLDRYGRRRTGRASRRWQWQASRSSQRSNFAVEVARDDERRKEYDQDFVHAIGRRLAVRVAYWWRFNEAGRSLWLRDHDDGHDHAAGDHDAAEDRRGDPATVAGTDD